MRSGCTLLDSFRTCSHSGVRSRNASSSDSKNSRKGQERNMFPQLLLLIALLIVLGLTSYHFYVHKFSKVGLLVNRIPGPRVLPVLGNCLNYSFMSLEGLWTAKRNLSLEYHSIFRLWCCFWPLVILIEPKDVAVLFSSKKNITKALGYNVLQPWLGTGLGTSTGEKWRQRRKMLAPFFHFKILESFLESFDKHARDMVESLRTLSDLGDPVDLFPVASHYTLNVNCETAMGFTLKEVGHIEHACDQMIEELGRHVTYRITKPWLYMDFLFSLTPVGREHAPLLERLHGFTDRIVEMRKKYHRKTGWKNLEYHAAGTGKRRIAMLDILIANWRQGNIDDAGIREEVDTFVFAGQDTTARALTFTILCLAENRDYQDRCRREIDEVLGSGVIAGVKMADLQRLLYLEQCIKETLRLYPSASMIMRLLEEDMYLTNYVVPAGSTAVVAIHEIHRNPEYWSDPDTFDPDRFLPEKMVDRHPFSYIPFSGGLRNCIGQKFAMLELKTVLAQLLHNFEFEAVDKRDGVQFRIDVSSHPTKPIRVIFVPRVEKKSGE